MYFSQISGNINSIYQANILKAASHVEKHSIYRYNIKKRFISSSNHRLIKSIMSCIGNLPSSGNIM